MPTKFRADVDRIEYTRLLHVNCDLRNAYFRAHPLEVNVKRTALDSASCGRAVESGWV